MIIIAWNWYPFVLFSHITPSFSVFSHEHQTSCDINNTDGLTHLKSIATNSYYLDGIGYSAVTKTFKILAAYSSGWCGLGVALQGHTWTWSTCTSVMAQAINEDVVNHMNRTLAPKVSPKWCVSVVLTFHWLNQITWPYPTSDGAEKAILHGPRKRRTTNATAVSPVAKHWAMSFVDIIFINSLQHLYELGAIYRPNLQIGNGSCGSSR